MPTCLLHWKPDEPWKVPVLMMKISTLFLERLRQGFLAFAQIEKIPLILLQSSKWVLIWFQIKRYSGSNHQRLKSVPVLNIKEIVIIFGRFKFFQWYIWGLFYLKGKATIWGLIPPKESSVAVDELESLGEVSALPITQCIKRQCPPSGSAVFLDPINSYYQLLFLRQGKVPFSKDLFQVLKTGEGDDTIPFFRVIFWKKTFYRYSNETEYWTLSSSFSHPENVLLRGWDKIYIRTWCEVGTGNVKFLFVLSFCVCLCKCGSLDCGTKLSWWETILSISSQCSEPLERRFSFRCLSLVLSKAENKV